MPRPLAPEERYLEWVRYLEAAYRDIVHAFWNRKVFRAITEMFDTNPQVRGGEGGPTARKWVDEMYVHYVVMLVRRELDSQSGVLSLTRMLYDMEEHHDVLVAQAKGAGVPSIDNVSADREALQAATTTVVDCGNRIVAHRTPLATTDMTWAQLDEALRALRKTLIKYNGILNASDLASAIPTPQFDWLAPFRVAWITEGFEEPEAEEEAMLSEAEKLARRDFRRKLGFNRL